MGWRRARSSSVGSVLLLAAVAFGTNAHAASSDREAIAHAVDRSLPYLDRDGRSWMAGEHALQDGSGCVSCHQVPFGVWSQHEAMRSGLGRLPDSRRALTRDAVDFVSDEDVARAASLSVLLIGLGDAAGKDPWRERVLAWSKVIGRLQNADGSWPAKGQFPSQRRPVPESDAVVTMWMIYGLSQISELPAPLRRRRARALRWLTESEPGVSTEWWAWRLVVAHVFGLDDSRWRDEVWARQRPDGGWSFLADGRSDAYTTGETIYALQCAGVTTDDPRLARAVAWLLEHQADDGTWSTPSRGLTTADTSRTDEVYRYWGTAWAVIGLSSVADERR